MPDLAEEHWRKSRSQHWDKREVIDQRVLKHLLETLCSEPYAGCCGGWGVRDPRLSD